MTKTCSYTYLMIAIISVKFCSRSDYKYSADYAASKKKIKSGTECNLLEMQQFTVNQNVIKLLQMKTF